jgi:hypothetical protein
MRLDRLFQAALILCAAGCTKDFNDTIPCASDLNCPSGYHCAASGKCQTGEASVRVEWLSPASGAAMRGAQTFSVKVSHPDGVSTVKLVAGATHLGTFTAPSAGFGVSAPAQVDFTAVDTSQVADGNVTIDAQGTSSKGQGGSLSRAFVLDNHESAPFFASGSMSSGNTTNGPRLAGTAATGPTPSNV